jgi:hypothetical protein
MIKSYNRTRPSIFFKKLIPLVSFRQEDWCVHPLHFAVEKNEYFVADVLCRQFENWDEHDPILDSLYDPPTSITKKLDFGDKDKETKLRQECQIPEEVEFDLFSYYLYGVAFTESLVGSVYIFNVLKEYCRNKGRSKSAINPVVAVMYGQLHKNSYLRNLISDQGCASILEVAVDTCTFCDDNHCLKQLFTFSIKVVNKKRRRRLLIKRPIISCSCFYTLIHRC